MEFLRQWLLGAVACALLVSAAEQLCPRGSVRTVMRFVGGLLLMMALLRPLTRLRIPDAAWDTASYREAVTRAETSLALERENTLRRGIAAQWEAYIEDKAESLGAAVRAEVELETRGGAALPGRVTLHGPYSAALAGYLANELGVAKEKQLWIGES